jgi:putative SOS response-associated peptidase YedK
MFLDWLEISFWLKDKQKISSSSLLERIKSHPVSKYVNSPINNDQRCILETHMER